jgi:hypothetical protein
LARTAPTFGLILPLYAPKGSKETGGLLAKALHACKKYANRLFKALPLQQIGQQCPPLAISMPTKWPCYCILRYAYAHSRPLLGRLQGLFWHSCCRGCSSEDGLAHFLHNSADCLQLDVEMPTISIFFS